MNTDALVTGQYDDEKQAKRIRQMRTNGGLRRHSRGQLKPEDVTLAPPPWAEDADR